MSGVFGGATVKAWELVATLYDFGVDGAIASVETPNLEDDFDYAIAFAGVSSDAATTYFKIKIWREGGAAWEHSDDTGLITTDTAWVVDGLYFLDFARVTSPVKMINGHSARNDVPDVGSAGVIIGANAKIQKARAENTNGNWDAGQIYLYRRAL